MLRRLLVTPVVLGVIGVSLTGPVRAQSLGEVAAREAKRRAAAPHAAKVVTDADLKGVQGADDSPNAAAEGTPASTPTAEPKRVAAAVPAPEGPPPQGHCLGDNKTSSKISRPEPGVVVIAWVVDVANYCAQPHDIRATYQVWGAGDVLLQSDQQDLSIAAKARATASGKMRLTADTWARVARRSSVAQFR
jgi:hypothetical protein